MSTTSIIFWVVVIGAIFGYMWYQGQITRLADYIRATREELIKCTWPTFDELKGQTALIFVAIALVGGFTMVIDFISLHVLQFMFRLVS
jgi:preprotein translocase SecE subunit